MKEIFEILFRNMDTMVATILLLMVIFWGIAKIVRAFKGYR